MEDLRYQHTYHPVPIEEKCPALANVLNQISGGLFGDSGVYEPLLNTIRQGDHYLLSDDFDSCACPSCVLPCTSYLRGGMTLDIAALAMVDEAYLDRTEWVKKSIRTSAKVRAFCLLRFFYSGVLILVVDG